MSHSLLTRSGLDLSVAVFLAKASHTAYEEAAVADAWARVNGFYGGATSFSRSNVQGFWCVQDDVALLAFRGTQNIAHWLRNVRVVPWKHPWGMVHRGFLDGVYEVEQDLLGFESAARNAKHVWVTGHSLGGAMAVIATARLKMNGIPASLYTYGQPKMSFSGFGNRFAMELPGRYVRFVNQDDVVPRVPPLYSHFGRLKRIVRPGVLESAFHLESSPLSSPEAAARAVAAERAVGGAALESARAIASSGIKEPMLIDAELPELNEQQFMELQIAMGGAEPVSPFESAGLEGFFPSVADHAITEYIRLLAEIRDLPN